MVFFESIMPKFTIEEISQKLGVPYTGDPNAVITGVAPLESAEAGTASFLDASKFRKYLKTTQATLIILNEKLVAECRTNALVTNNPQYVFAKLAKLFQKLPAIKAEIHASAVIADSAEIHDSVYVGANVVIGRNVVIGENSIIGPNSVIDDDCKLGANCRLWANVTLYYGVVVHNSVEIHSGAVIGADGFGLAQSPLGWEKIPQLGSVEIHSNVEIGANTTIDRGAMDNTVIGEGSKLDNQIQIGHNVKIGENSIIAGCTGVAGSTKIGDNCMIGGGVGFNGHLDIADNVIITGMSAVGKSLHEPGIYSSGQHAIPMAEWRKQLIATRKLDKMADRLKQLEKQLTTESDS